MWEWLLNTEWANKLIASSANHLITAGAGMLSAWLLDHGASMDISSQIVGGLSAAALAAVGFGISVLKARLNTSQQKVALASPAPAKMALSPAEQALVSKAWGALAAPVSSQEARDLGQ